MTGWIVDLIGRHAKILAIVLVALVTVNVGWQFYTYKTTPLTAWKGGGFGMYTTPHADHRTVWLEFEGADGTAQVRLYPNNPELKIWIEGVSSKGGTALRQISNQGAALRYYPRKTQAQALITNAARIGWLDTLTDGVKPKEGATFKPEDIRVLVYENVQDWKAGKVTRQIVFEGGVRR